MVVDLIVDEGPQDGITIPNAADFTRAEDWGFFPITEIDPTDGLLKIFLYQKSPVSNKFILVDVVLADEVSNNFPPAVAGLITPVVTTDWGWTQKYGTNETCISATASADITIVASNTQVTFDLTTTTTTNGTRVIHILGTARKVANCPNDPSMINSVLKTTQWLVNTNAAQAIHSLNGLRGRGIMFFSQWIVPTGPDAGWTNGVMCQIW